MEKYGIVYNSDEMAEVIEQAEKFGKVRAPILIYGETGVGKELVTKALYQNSGGLEKFVTIDCAAFSKELVESELFGHERGAFTGAHTTRIGKFEAANKGMVFLDEVGEIPYVLQQKLLRIVETMEFCRVGSNKTVRTNVSIVTATNKDLKLEIKERRFREDLYYRISSITIFIPPLRSRPADIPVLARTFTDKFISPEAINKLMRYHWPGNVRELKNVISYANHNTDGDKIFETDIRFDSELFIGEKKLALPTLDLERLERVAIIEALRLSNYRQSEAAKLLNISSRAMNYKVQKWGIRHKGWRVFN